jgi:hypothetical protein
MTHSLSTSTSTPARPSGFAMLEEVLDLSVGFIVVSLPLLILALPGIIVFFVVPAVLIGIVAAAVAAVLAVLAAPPYLLVRWLRRRSRPTAAPPAARANGAPNSIRVAAPAPRPGLKSLPS